MPVSKGCTRGAKVGRNSESKNAPSSSSGVVACPPLEGSTILRHLSGTHQQLIYRSIRLKYTLDTTHPDLPTNEYVCCCENCGEGLSKGNGVCVICRTSQFTHNRYLCRECMKLVLESQEDLYQELEQREIDTQRWEPVHRLLSELREWVYNK